MWMDPVVLAIIMSAHACTVATLDLEKFASHASANACAPMAASNLEKNLTSQGNFFQHIFIDLSTCARFTLVT